MTLAANPPQVPPGERASMAAIARHFPPRQFGRYLLVGVGNTLFGYGTFALLVAILDRVVPHGYILASAISSVLNITVSYLNYKWFVFKTKGNYLREWVRCVVVYSSAIVINVLLLPVLVFAIRRWTSYYAGAPYIAGAVLIGCTTIYSFVGHRRFSFRSPPLEASDPRVAGSQEQ
jgi:putative flippase GtrA